MLLQTEEEKLFADCIKGDLNAKRKLYSLYAGKLFSVCLQYAGNREDAEDVLQDAFIKIFQKIDQFRGEGSLEGWLRRIVVNTAIKQYHKKCRLYPVSTIENLDGDVEDSLDEDQNFDFTMEELMSMIQSLSPRYRMVFNLYALEGLSHKEIAETMQISEGTSKSQLSRSRVLLQEMVKEKIRQKENDRQQKKY